MGSEKEEIRWYVKDLYQELLGCKYWYAPILKGWIPCRFPALRLAGVPPCKLCWRYYIYNTLLKIKGGRTP
ncbi:MAG: hypothetical protein DRN91_06910 [Candidatus Alkanophagales archaeon]|nr:MAG: hypothetical protein DRN91_06910 [Candidatus Alkanophagales archaeon]